MGLGGLSSGVQAYWPARRNAFSPRFRELVESVRTNAGVLRVGELAADELREQWTLPALLDDQDAGAPLT
jgi:hypothetical protein